MADVPCSPPAARGCHLHLSQLSRTSSRLLLPEDPGPAGLRPRGPHSRPICPLPPLVFIRFSGSSALVSASPVLEDKVYPRAALRLAGAGPLQLRLCIGCIPHPCGKVTPPISGQQHLPRVNPGGPRLAVLGGFWLFCAQPAASRSLAPWEPAPQNQARAKPALEALSAATALAPGRRGVGVPAGFWVWPELGTSLPSLCSPW